MKDLAITINGVRYKVKDLDFHFAKFVEESLEEYGVMTNRDNKVEKLFFAYLNLAQKYHKQEQEIEDLVKSIEL